MGKKIIIILLFLSMLPLAYGKDYERKKQVAVLNFEPIAGINEIGATTLTDKFRSSLIQTGVYNVIERDDLSIRKLIEEQGKKLQGITLDTLSLVEAGKLLACEKIFLGKISKIGNKWSVTIKMIDVTSASVENSITEESTKNSEELPELFNVLAQKISGTYIDPSKKWWWIGSGIVAIVAGVVAYIVTKPEPSTPEVGSPPPLPSLNK